MSLLLVQTSKLFVGKLGTLADVLLQQACRWPVASLWQRKNMEVPNPLTPRTLFVDVEKAIG